MMWFMGIGAALIALGFLLIFFVPEETVKSDEPEIPYRYYHNPVTGKYIVQGWYKHHKWQTLREHTNEKDARDHIKAIKANENPTYIYYDGND